MFVTRSAYDALQRSYDKLETRYENLLDRYHALRLQNHTARSEAAPVAPPQSDVDLVYHTQRNLAYETAYQDFIARGMTEEQARAEARTAIDSLFAPIAGDFQ